AEQRHFVGDAAAHRDGDIADREYLDLLELVLEEKDVAVGLVFLLQPLGGGGLVVTAAVGRVGLEDPFARWVARCDLERLGEPNIIVEVDLLVVARQIAEAMDEHADNRILRVRPSELRERDPAQDRYQQLRRRLRRLPPEWPQEVVA